MATSSPVLTFEPIERKLEVKDWKRIELTLVDLTKSPAATFFYKLELASNSQIHLCTTDL